MITAKDAKSVSQDLSTQRCKDVITHIDQAVREAASNGEQSLNIARFQPTDSMKIYFESLGYRCVTTKNEYDVYVVFNLNW
jgi:hypothetical protein